jgi:hypothetical protein
MDGNNDRHAGHSVAMFRDKENHDKKSMTAGHDCTERRFLGQNPSVCH